MKFTGASPSSDRESSNSQASIFYDYHAALIQGFLYVRQAVKKEFRLRFGTPPGTTAEDYDRRSGGSSERQYSAEIRVSRDEHSIFATCKLENFFIGRCLHPTFPDMQSFVARFAEFIGDSGREGVVYKEFQGAGRIGIPLSRTATAA